MGLHSNLITKVYVVIWPQITHCFEWGYEVHDSELKAPGDRNGDEEGKRKVVG